VELQRDFKEFIELLNENDVEYLVIGGYAVAFHGYPRFTQDIDIWVRPTRENARRVVETLSDFDFPTDKIRIETFTEPDVLFQLGRPPFRIDILTTVDGIKFENCYKRRIIQNWDGLELKVISLKDLRKNKQASGRDKDLVDLKRLNKL
jgi:hypothetical protein